LQTNIYNPPINPSAGAARRREQQAAVRLVKVDDDHRLSASADLVVSLAAELMNRVAGNF
jgi:hypothetical protein